MAKLSLQEIRAKLLEQTKKDQGTKKAGGDNASYPFWNNPDGSTAKIRFLPDGDASNDVWWVEKLNIKLPFPSIKGQQPTGKPITVDVPCMDMWTPFSCPINQEIKPWWKGGKELEDMAKKYWRKKSYLFQGFVVTNPNPEDSANLPENPIRRFVINQSVYDRIKVVFAVDSDVENDPIDYVNGLEFNLVKGKKGEWADYGSSSWARKERALSDAELRAIDTFGLFNLSNFLPKKPDDAHAKAILDLFHDSVDERPFDPEKYAHVSYKPYGVKVEGSSTSVDQDVEMAERRILPRNVSVTAPSVQEDINDAPFDSGKPIRNTEPASEPKKSTQDILEALRRKQAAKG
jgi:hypothetical protein